jgi:hypothetical protein
MLADQIKDGKKKFKTFKTKKDIENALLHFVFRKEQVLSRNKQFMLKKVASRLKFIPV